MIADLWTVIAKEWRELLLQRGNVRGALVSLILPCLILGVMLPAQFGAPWLRSPAAVTVWAWVPLLMVAMMIADSVAGERERETLETLLATRLPDLAILFGKLLASVGYAGIMTALIIVFSVVTVNLVEPGEFIGYPLELLLAGLALGGLSCGAMASLGVLISQRSPTVRLAAQRLSLMVMALAWTPVLLATLLPIEAKRQLAEAVRGANAVVVAGGCYGALVLANVVFLGLAIKQFRRHRLILEE